MAPINDQVCTKYLYSSAYKAGSWTILDTSIRAYTGINDRLL